MAPSAAKRRTALYLLLKVIIGAAVYSNTLASMGRLKDAEEHYLDALRLRSGYYGKAHYGLAVVYLETGLHEKARHEFEAALRADPGDIRAKLLLDSIRK